MSLSERKHPSITETTIAFASPEESQALATLRAQVSPQHDDITDMTLYRFLTSRGGDADRAREDFLAYMQWRHEEHLDTILDQPVDKLEIIQKIVPYAYLGYDIDGRPIYYEKTGAVQCAALADPSIITPDAFLRSHAWGMEYMLRLAHDKSLELGRRVDTLASVLDMEGLGFHHRNALFVLKACMDFDVKYYPNRVGRLYVLNTPWVAPYLYQLAAPLVPANVRDLLHVVPSPVGEFLCSVIPAENVPAEYGGKGPNIVVRDASDLAALAAQADDGLEKVYVSTEFEKEISCDDKGATFSWFFESEGGYDIDFSVLVYDAADAAKPPLVAKPAARCITNRGSYVATGATRVVARWDNSFSYFTGKNIKYMMSAVQVQGIDQVPK